MNELIRSLRGFKLKKRVPPAHENLEQSKSVEGKEDSAVVDEESQGDASSHIDDSIISQPPLTEAGESTEEGGLKRKRARTNFYSPDIRPDIVIFRESNEKQRGLHEDPMHPFSRKRRIAQTLQNDSLEEEEEAVEKRPSTDRFPNRSQKATDFSKAASRPNADMFHEPNPEQESLESEVHASSSQEYYYAITDECRGNAQHKGISFEVAAISKAELASAVPKHIPLCGKEGLARGEKGKYGKERVFEKEERTSNGAILGTHAKITKPFNFVLSHDDDSSEEERRERTGRKTYTKIQNQRRKNANVDSGADDSLFGESSQAERRAKPQGGLHKRNGVGRYSHIENQQKGADSMHVSRKMDIALSSRALTRAMFTKGLEIYRGQCADSAVNTLDRSKSKTPQVQQRSRVSPFGRKANVIGKSALFPRDHQDRSGEARGSRSKRKIDQQMSYEGFCGEGNNRESSSGEERAPEGVAVDNRGRRVTVIASSRQTKVKEEETFEVEGVETNDKIEAGSEAGSSLATNDAIIIILPKEKKEQRRRRNLTAGCGSGGPMPVSDMLDDKSGIAFRASMAILCKFGSKAALQFCHRCLRDYYGKAEKGLEALMGDETLAKRCKLLKMRITIAGLWCACARLLLSIADRIPVETTLDVPKLKQIFDHVDKNDLPKIRKALIDAALMVLGQAAACPLAGNHAWIALSYSKIVQTAFSKSGQSVDDRDAAKIVKPHRLLHTAGTLCQISLANSRQGRHYYDQKLLDRLVQAGIIYESTIAGLFGAQSEPLIMGTIPTCVDKSSDTLLCNELNLLNIMQATGYSSKKKTRPTINQSLASLLSRLPVPSDEVTAHRFIFEQAYSNAGRSYSRADMTVSTESYALNEEIHQRVESEVYSFNSMYCFGVEMVGQDLPKETRKSRMWEVQQCENEHEIIHSFHVQDKRKLAILDGCQGVTFYCPSCGSQAEFRSEGALQNHIDSCLSKVQDVTGIKGKARNRFRFGSSNLIGDWTKDSIDPENSPLLSSDELLDVLEYSVEFFEVQKEHVSNVGWKLTEYSLTSPRRRGQFGLRCQHCHEDWEGFGCEGSFVFPESIAKLPQAFWYLSLTHLDNCEHQPRAVQHWHREYRKHVRLDSFLPSDYWTHMASEMNLVSAEPGGLMYHGK